MQPGRMPKPGQSVWPTVRARRKKYAWISTYKPAGPHRPWYACVTMCVTGERTFSDLDEVAVTVDALIVAVERQKLENCGAGPLMATVERPDALVGGVVVDCVFGEVRRLNQQRVRWTRHSATYYRHTTSFDSHSLHHPTLCLKKRHWCRTL